MIIYVNERNEIKDVNTTSDPKLRALKIDDKFNPFFGWTVAKICCYKANVINNRVVSMTPYVDARLIEHIDELGKEVEGVQSDIEATQDAICSYIEENEEHLGLMHKDMNEISRSTKENTKHVLQLGDSVKEVSEGLETVQTGVSMINEEMAATQDAFCENMIYSEERLGQVEDAICALTEMIIERED